MNFNFMNWLRKHQRVVLYSLLSCFVISIFFGLGLYMHSGGAAGDTVAEVNDEKIPYSNFTTLYNRLIANRREKGEDLSPEVLAQAKQEVIQSLIQEAVFYQEAQRYGIIVTDQELAQSLASYPAFQKDGKFDIQAYASALRYAIHSTPEEFEEQQRRQIAIQHLRSMVMMAVKITDRELEEEYKMAKAMDKSKKMGSFEAEKAKLKDALQQEKGAQILNRWYQQLGTNLKIKVHLDELEKRGR